MILFVIKFTVSLLVIYAIYMVFFANENAPVFKRYFLIAGIVFSLLIPFLNFDFQTIHQEAALPVRMNEQIIRIDEVGEKILLTDSPGFGIKHIVAITYITILLLLSIRYALNIYRLTKSGKKTTRASIPF